MSRQGSVTAPANLARIGFQDGARAASLLAQLDDWCPAVSEPLAPLLARTADPDQALDQLLALGAALSDREGGEERRAMLRAVADDEGTAMRLLCVLGLSSALAAHLRRHPEQWRELTDPTLGTTRPAAYSVRAGLLAAVADLPYDDAVDALRVEYNRVLLRLVARDLAHDVGVDDVAAELSDLAAGTVGAALAIARAKTGSEARLAVVAMGKCGAHELNYVSDVDVIFVAEPADAGATRLAATLMQVCSAHTGEGTIWPVDANLRPEGKNGPLVRTIESHVGYYERWARSWEFQALLKARPVAGDVELGRLYEERIQPFVWSASEREGFVEEVQAMRRRVLDHIPAADADRQLKLGSGGLRDVEFAVQLLQLVHGRADESLRVPTTLSALARLIEGGYVGRDDGQQMHDGYAFLRRLEHRIQLQQLRRTQVVPDDAASLRRLGRSLGWFKDAGQELEREWRHHRLNVRRLHEKLFYRPLLGAVARLPEDGVRLTPEAARARLSALGYADPDAALRNLEVLTAGVSRTAAIQRTLLPAMLEWFAGAPDPDAGLFGFRKISEALGRTPWYLGMLRDEGKVAQRVAQVLATSRYTTDLLQREPEGVRILGTELKPLDREAIETEMRASASRRDNPTAAALAIRSVRRRELLRISAADLCEPFGVAEVGYSLTDLTDATLEVALGIAVRAVEAERKAELPTRLAIVAMGRYGGGELGYGSDADVMFVHEPQPGADAHHASSMANAVANELRRLLSLPSTDPPLEVDANLRPEGKGGPLTRTLGSYAAYYAKWSAVWEAQALLRADAVVGDREVCRRFTEMIDPLRYPTSGLTADDVREIRRIKARVDDERLPRGVDPATHFKLGRGGIADVEWTVQVLQLQHAHEVAALRTPKTLPALAACVDAGLLDAADAEALRAAWLMSSRARNATVQVRGRASDQLPRDARERAAVAALMRYPAGETDAMVNEYQRVCRRAAAVVDRVFWG